MSKFKVGDRVTGVNREQWAYGEVYTITEVRDGKYRLGEMGPCNWEYDELKLVDEGDKSVERRTFKLLKAMPGVPKGTLFQEECEDGTQPYSVIDGMDNAPRYEDRSLVEDNPEWFVEVFKVHPEYMTREELDRFESIKSGTPKERSKNLA